MRSRRSDCGLRELLEAVARGQMGVEEAEERLLSLEYLQLGSLCLDVGRHMRRGFPEVVLCEGKSAEDAAKAAEAIYRRSGLLLATRASKKHADAIKKRIPNAVFHQKAGCVTAAEEPLKREGLVAIVAAGASDIPVAEEARVTAEITGSETYVCYDVGVAGLHRLTPHMETMREANCCVVVAGMEGALPSVVAGLVGCPVVAVPTSVGYGASFGGLAALLAMLNCCVPGVAVVNIDNGFGAGYLASLINRGRGRWKR